MDELKTLLTKITALREELNSLVKTKDNLLDDETFKISLELDAVLAEYEKAIKERRRAL